MKRVPLKISPSAQPKVPTSFRVPDGLSRPQFDSLQNLITGLGTGKDKLTGTTYVFTEMGKPQLEAAFRSDWIARKVVAIPAQDATREWRSWQSDNKDIEALENLEKELKLQAKTRAAITKARLYGGAALLIGANSGGAMDQPLDPSKVGKDQLKFVHVVTRHELSAGEIDWDIESPYYGTPKYFTRSGMDNPGERIHPSRVVRFIGNEVPDVTLTLGWGDSILQAVNDAVLAAGMTTAAGAQMLNEMKMDVIRIPDLTASMSNKQYASRLTDRFGLANTAKSLYNMLLLDKDEEWQRITTTLTGLPDTLKMYLLIASGAADIPATRMLSQSPAGMNATGESDLRNHYDNVKSVQTNDIQPTMSPLDECLIRSALGTFKPGDIVYEWNPLWQLDEQTSGTIMAQKSAAFKVDVDAALIPAEVMRDARINQLIEDGVYPGLEQILDDYGPLEDIEEDPEPGAMIGPDGKPISPDDPTHPQNPNNPANQNFDPKTGQPTKGAANNNAKPPNKKAIGDMAARIKRAKLRDHKRLPKEFKDATPRSLYVYRKVTNAAAIIAWAKREGIAELEDKAELHVTIMYCTTPVDWTKAGEMYSWSADPKNGTMSIAPGGMRMVDKFDGGACVLLFASSRLSERHCQIKWSCEIEYDYPSYQPHITVAYPKGGFDPLKFAAYTGPIELGIEVWEVAKDYVPGATQE